MAQRVLRYRSGALDAGRSSNDKPLPRSASVSSGARFVITARALQCWEQEVEEQSSSRWERRHICPHICRPHLPPCTSHYYMPHYMTRRPSGARQAADGVELHHPTSAQLDFVFGQVCQEFHFFRVVFYLELDL